MKKVLIVCAVLGFLCQGMGLAVPVSGSWQTRLLLILEGPQPKIVSPTFALESLLQLQLELSGLKIKSLTALSTVGLEAQIFNLSFSIGPLTLTDIFIFSRNIIEVEEVLPKIFQIRFVRPDPGGIVGQYLPLLYPDPVTPYARLALLLGPTLTEPVILRKKTVEAQLAIGGLTLKIVGLFANFGEESQWEVGTLLVLSGETVSGLRARSETYIGARRGLECFAECTPEVQFPQGRVVSGFEFEYERLTLSNIKLLGITIELDGAFNFNLTEGPGPIAYLQITSFFRLEPLKLDITDILYFNSDLLLGWHTLITSWSVGEAFVMAIWTDLSGGFTFALREFFTGLSLGSFSFTSDLLTCASEPSCSSFWLAPIYQHDLSLSWKGGPWSARVLFSFLGFLRPLNKFVATFGYEKQGWSWHIGMAIQPSGLKVQEFFVSWRF